MNLTLELEGSSDAQLLIELYLNQIKVEKQEIAQKERNVRSMNAKVMQLRRMLNGTSNTPTRSDDYSDKWQWVKKIEFALSDTKKPLTTSEIIDVLMEYEPDMDRKKAISSASGTLSTKSGDIDDLEKDFIRTTNERGEYSYELRTLKNAASSQESILDLDDLPF